MARKIDLEALLKGCADDSFDDGIRIDTELVPLAGPGGPVKPAVYEGGVYQQDRRWDASDAAEPTPVIVNRQRAVAGQPPGRRAAPTSQIDTRARACSRPVGSASATGSFAEKPVEPGVPASQWRCVSPGLHP